MTLFFLYALFFTLKNVSKINFLLPYPNFLVKDSLILSHIVKDHIFIIPIYFLSNKKYKIRNEGTCNQDFKKVTAKMVVLMLFIIDYNRL